ADGVRHVAVVARVAHGRGEDAVDEDRARGLVDLVLDRFGVLRDFDDDVDFVRRIGAGGNEVQAHGGGVLRVLRWGAHILRAAVQQTKTAALGPPFRRVADSAAPTTAGPG